jgi:hypothetical protein
MWSELLIVATLSIAVALMLFGAGLYFGHRNERKAFKPVHGEWRLWQEQPPPKKPGQIILVKHPGEQYQLLTWDRYDARDRDWFWFDLSECRKLNRYNFKEPLYWMAVQGDSCGRVSVPPSGRKPLDA